MIITIAKTELHKQTNKQTLALFIKYLYKNTDLVALYTAQIYSILNHIRSFQCMERLFEKC